MDQSIDIFPYLWFVAKWGIIGLLVIYLISCIKILAEYERAVVFRLGRVRPARGPGIIGILPFLERAERVDMRVQTIDLPAQDIITKDNVSVSVRAVLYYQVIDAVKSEVEIDGYEDAAIRIAGPALRYIGGSTELDDLLGGAQRISQKVQEIVDEQTEKWGIRVSMVEIQTIDLPDDMKRAIAAQAEAERQKRAKIIAADGELQAAEKLSQAAKIMSENPSAIQLRYLQTLTEIGAENNTTVVFPLPVELFPSLKAAENK